MKNLLKYLALGVIGVVCLDILFIYIALVEESKPLSYETFFPAKKSGDFFSFRIGVFFICLVFFSPFLWITDKLLINNRWRYLIGGIFAGFILGFLMVNGSLHNSNLVLFTALGLFGGFLLTLVTWWIDSYITK